MVNADGTPAVGPVSCVPAISDAGPPDNVCRNPRRRPVALPVNSTALQKRYIPLVLMVMSVGAPAGSCIASESYTSVPVKLTAAGVAFVMDWVVERVARHPGGE